MTCTTFWRTRGGVHHPFTKHASKPAMNLWSVSFENQCGDALHTCQHCSCQSMTSTEGILTCRDNLEVLHAMHYDMGSATSRQRRGSGQQGTISRDLEGRHHNSAPPNKSLAINKTLQSQSVVRSRVSLSSYTQKLRL